MENEDLPVVESKESETPSKSRNGFQQTTVQPQPKPAPAWRAFIGSMWQTRHKRLRRRLVVWFSVCLVAVGLAWIYYHWKDPDRDFKVTNFVAAFFPFPASVFIAFLPDMERAEKMRPVWRGVIVVGGLAYSLVLWHQQSVNVAASRREQAEIVSSAVDRSNQHADKQIEGVRTGLKQGLKEVSDHSDQQITTVKDQVREQLSKLYSKTTSGLGELGVSIDRKSVV
jgi:hypothetical protein